MDLIKKLTGKSPLNWEKELNIQEVTIAKWEDKQILLVRPKKAGDDSKIEENPYMGYLACSDNIIVTGDSVSMCCDRPLCP